jgi:hypothetical protein
MSRIKMIGGVLAALATVTAFAIPSSASAEATQATATPPANARIDVKIINGSGCPAGTADVSMNGDNTAFTVTYSDYLAVAGDHASPIEFRKNCQLTLQVDVPSGYSYAIRKVDYSGFAYLTAGAEGLMQAAYYFQGSPGTSYSPHEFDGPYNDTWSVSDSYPLVWSGCGDRPLLNINTELRVYAAENGSTSLMAMDSTRARSSSVYQLAWESC